MKYKRVCTVPRGHEIPEGEDGYSVEVIPESIADEVTLKTEAICELEKVAIDGINVIIANVEKATGRTLKGVKYVEAQQRKQPRHRPTLHQPEYGELRTHMYTLGQTVAKHWDFDDEESFLEWCSPILCEGHRS